MQSVFLYVDNAFLSDNEYRKFSLNIMLSKETVLTLNNRFIYCKREVDYAYYGAYACDTRIVRYVGILRRLVVLIASDSNKTAFSFGSKRSFDWDLTSTVYKTRLM